MPSRWLRWSRSPREDSTLTEIPAELTRAFLDMERRLDVAQHAVHSAIAVGNASLAEEWVTARDQAYAATARYLAVAAPDSAASPPASLAEVARSIDTARSALDAFYDRHRHALDSAVGAVTAARARAEEALAATAVALQRLPGLDPQLACYPSVQSARTSVETGRGDMQSALAHGDVTAITDTAQRLQGAAAALEEAITAAPERGERARRTLVSVQTRLAATTHRADTVTPTFSVLLREFHADSSADLRDNERRARTHITAAREFLERAATELDQGRPEQTTTLAGEAREELGRAEELIDGVTDRLSTLRALRTDPTARERDIRFRVRDAQRLAVDRDAVAEWGTVLDAQVLRIDRIVATLNGRHPDYWKYHLALEEVSQFVSTIINRIRHQSAAR